MNRMIVVCVFALAACQAPITPAPLADAKIGGPFVLTDQNGKNVTEKTVAPAYRIMYFGYTFCPDVCPTDVANLTRGLKVFGRPDKVRLVFVSVDPSRDTPARLKEFVGSFDPAMIALTGTPEAIEQTAKSFGVAYSIAPGQSADAYLVDHSRVAYLMDSANRPIALIPEDGTPQAIAIELGKWIK